MPCSEKGERWEGCEPPSVGMSPRGSRRNPRHDAGLRREPYGIDRQRPRVSGFGGRTRVQPRGLGRGIGLQSVVKNALDAPDGDAEPQGRPQVAAIGGVVIEFVGFDQEVGSSFERAQIVDQLEVSRKMIAVEHAEQRAEPTGRGIERPAQEDGAVGG